MCISTYVNEKKDSKMQSESDGVKVWHEWDGGEGAEKRLSGFQRVAGWYVYLNMETSDT